ncbi:MAG: glycosyl hydrolase family 18 protein [Clostridia bacterium]|nr:glycosyl hydrolase family 18 protein [Clostridia bacterium]
MGVLKGKRKIFASMFVFVMVFSLFFMIAALGTNAEDIPEWKSGTAYKAGDVVSYSGQYYKCTFAHTSNDAWTPKSAPTLWTITNNYTPTPTPTGGGSTGGDYPEWQVGNSYKVGDIVKYKGEYYKCLSTHVAIETWAPGTPGVWDITEGPTPTPRPTLDPSKPTPTPYPTMPPSDPTKRKVVGYYTEWSIYGAHQGYYPKHIPWDKITHINYAFAKTSGGRIALFDTEAAIQRDLGDGPTGCLGQIKKMKAQYPGVKVLISVGGWTLSSEFHDIALTETSRNMFADSCVAFIKKYGLDGVDIDWEYPNYNRDPDKVDNQNDTGCIGGPEDKHNYTLLCKTLRERLDEAGYYDKKRYELTIAAPAGYDKIIWTEPELLGNYLDFLNLMTYDYHGAWETTTGHLAPLYASKSHPDQSELNNKYVTDWSVKEYLRLGVPAHKLTVGIPYYTRGWQGVKGGVEGLPGLFASATGGATGIWDGGRPAGTHPFYHVKNLENAGGYKKYTDPEAKTPYIFNELQGLMFTYEDEASLGVKLDYIIENNLGGAMFWEFSGDYPSKGSTLTNIIYNKFKSASPIVIGSPKPTSTPVPPTNTPVPTATGAVKKVYGYIKPDFDYSDAAASKVRSGIKVEVYGSQLSTLTDANGYFEINNVPWNGIYQYDAYHISKPGYLTRRVDGITSPYDVELGTKDQPLKIWAGDMPIDGKQDGAINMSDILEIINTFNSAAGDGKYVDINDIDKDGAINMQDILIIILHFNTTSSNYPLGSQP